MSNYIHLNPIVQQIDGNDATIHTNLFSHEFYYLQNNQRDINLRDCCKALLFLHTLPADYQNVNALFGGECAISYTLNTAPKTVGYTDITSYWYLLLLGSMIWRRRYMKSHNNSEPLQLSGDGITFKSPGVDKVWIANLNLFCTAFPLDYTSHKYSKYSDYINEGTSPFFEQKLLNMFLDFVNTKFKTVKECCEFTVVNSFGFPSNINHSMFKQIFNTLLNLSGKAPNYAAQYNILNGSQPITVTSNGVPINYYVKGFDKHYVMGFMLSIESDKMEGEKTTIIERQVADATRVDNTRQQMLEQQYVNQMANVMTTYPASAIHTYYSENSPVQEIFQEYFFTPCLIASIPSTISTNGISKSALQQYYKGYADSIIQSYEKTLENVDTVKLEKEKSKDERDLKCELYLSLKSIWDRWLCGYYYQEDGNGRYTFTVQNFFRNNFIFIDSFYTNIYDTLKLNCNFLRDNFVGSDDNNSTKLGKTTVAHLGDTASHHRCMMFNFPDSLNFSGLDENGQLQENAMYNHLGDMFKPIPANEVIEPEYSNKFTIIYTHSANKLDTNDRNKFVPDSFDIWSYDQETDVAPDIFKSAVKGPGKTEIEKLYPEARIAYKVPAFGVAYSRQDNSIWKKIDVRMDNFSVTEQSVKAMAAITEMGNSEKKNCVFYGQDLYSIYQSYSYLVTVEMMGNAQIQPLMYFQLMNIPMFRGTYMVISVEHSLSPGMMITKFTGMKMSKVQVPYTESWFTYPKEEDYDTVVNDESTDSQDVLTSVEGDNIDLADNNLSKIIKSYNSQTMDCDVFVQTVYNELFGNTIIPNKRINAESDDLFAYLNNSSDWKVVKFNPSGTKANNWKSLYSGSVYPKVGDVLFGYNNHQQTGLPSHMAIYLGVHRNTKYVVEGLSVPNGGDIQNYTTGVQIVRLENSRLSNGDNLMTYFAHYIPGNIQQVEYAKVSTSSSGSSGSSTAQTTYRTDDTPTDKIMPEDHKPIPNVDYTQLRNKDNGIWLMRELLNATLNIKGQNIKLNQLQVAAIMGCFYQESGWSPTALNKSSNRDYGVPQWIGDRKTSKYEKFLKDVYGRQAPGVNIENDARTLDKQLPYILYEFGHNNFKTYYSGTCKLWGSDSKGTVRFGKSDRYVNLCGNLMAWSNVSGYDEDALCNMVYRFMVAYENGNAPFHGNAFAYDNRCKFAKMAYNLYTAYKQGKYAYDESKVDITRNNA